MPYADPDKQRAAQAESYRRRYQNRNFARAEAERKAAWLQTEEGQLLNHEATRRFRNQRARTAFLNQRFLKAV